MSITDLLKPCDRSIPEGLEVILNNISMIRTMHRNRLGMDLRPSPTTTRDLELMKVLVNRCRKGDFRYKDSELQAMKNVAQWTVDEHMQLRGLPTKKIDWETPVV